MQGLLSAAKIIEIDGPLARNIISLRISEDLFDDLSSDSAEQAAAVRAEIATKPPQYHSSQPVINRPFEESEFYNAITFPFDNWMSNRFSDGHHGVWYGAPDIQTTVYETVHHWRQALQDAKGFEQVGVRTDRKVYNVACLAGLLDMRPAIPQWPALVHPEDYSLTQELGCQVNHQGHPGLMTRSARCVGDVCAIFNPRVLYNPRAACFLSYTLTQEGVRVGRGTDMTWMIIP